MTSEIIRRGNCHVFGDDIPLDEGFIAFNPNFPLASISNGSH
jgi:hypothetical protein